MVEVGKSANVGGGVMAVVVTTMRIVVVVVDLAIADATVVTNVGETLPMSSICYYC